MARMYIFIFFSVGLFPSDVCSSRSVLHLAYLVPWERGWPIGPYMGSAVAVGIKEVYTRQLLPGYVIEWTVRDSSCEPQRGMQMAVDAYSSVPTLHGIIGPSCSVACIPAGLLAAAWNVAMVAGCTSSTLSNKGTYPTFTRIVETKSARAPAFDKLVDMFGWKRVGIICTPEDVYIKSSIVLLNVMQKHNKTVIRQVVESTIRGSRVDRNKMNGLRNIMRGLKERLRIFVLMTYPLDLRNMLIAALDLGMLNGDYVFITHEYLLTEMSSRHEYRPEVDHSIYDGLLAIGKIVPSGAQYDAFRQDIIDSFQGPGFDHLPHLAANATLDEVDSNAGFAHDAVLQWAYGVNRTLALGISPENGSQVAMNIFSQQFEGITGTVASDEFGDRKPNIRVVIVQGIDLTTLMYWDVGTGEMLKLYKAGNANDWSGIKWHGNRTTIPRDTPLCGFLNEHCQNGQNDNKMPLVVVPITMCIVFLVVICILIVYAKKQRQKRKIMEINESVISWAELGQHKVTCATSIVSLDNPDLGHMSKIEVVKYNDMLVVVNRLGTERIRLEEQNVLADLKHMRGLSHDNINRFIGICIEPPNPCFIMAYASRGTLQNLLSREDIALSKDIQISFIVDIACGMWYLHQSVICFHGDLASYSCVVDSRWTCKVTGYGLRYIRGQHLRRYQVTNRVNPSKLLWTAPELLRCPQNEGMPILQKGDVFSFGVIASEVFTQDVPYAANIPCLEADDILEKVRAPRGSPYRPALPHAACSDTWLALIEQCWAEDHNQRPSFEQILNKINKIDNYKSLDLVDKMVKRLERHACDLEEKVIQRSRAIETEKVKMEVLLRELLPLSIANILAAGHKVQPDVFECITLFLSDIVGFTSISQAGSPMDTVTMLNTMYTVFDGISQGYDVYKVATIGDAYMVASGAPIRNGATHAPQICLMALALLARCPGIPIPHLPHEHIRVRIGIHSGPCVTGVVGVKMPRYALFGETVEIAGKMESSGEVMRIHISESTHALVHTDTRFVLRKAGQVAIKGKGHINTYWLDK